VIKLKKKVELDLILGVFLFSFGLISIIYSVFALIINVFFIRLGSFILIKDIFFEVVFVLLGFLLIRKKKIINVLHH